MDAELRKQPTADEGTNDSNDDRRRRVLLGGIVTDNDGARSVRCAIRNQTDAGALITIPNCYRLPPDIYLINMHERIAYEALTVWVDDPLAGIAFVKALPLAELSDPKLSYLNRLWHGNAPRREASAEFI
jgi:hypothetical protein